MNLIPAVSIAAPKVLVLSPPVEKPVTTAFVDQEGRPVLLTDIVRVGDRCTIRTRQGQEISGKAVIINRAQNVVVRVGDRSTIRTRQGQEISGKAVIINRAQNVVVLNGGGKYGRPVVACEENIVKVRKVN